LWSQERKITTLSQRIKIVTSFGSGVAVDGRDGVVVDGGGWWWMVVDGGGGGRGEHKLMTV
jgi:hypothetical protein